MTYFDDIRGGFETPAPSGYWPFYAAEGTGSTVWDYSGVGLPDAVLSGTYSRGTTLTLDGSEDNSLVLTGAGRGQATIYPPFVPEVFSVECIFKSADSGTLIDRDYSGERIFTLALDAGDIKLTKTSGTTGTRTTAIGTLDDNERHHVVLSINGDVSNIFVDGVLADTHTWAEDFDGTGENLGIGGSFNGGTSATTLLFTGTIDEVAWYEAALSEADAAVHAGWLGLMGSSDITGTIELTSPHGTTYFFSASPEPIESAYIVASGPVGWWEADSVTGLDSGDPITELTDSSGNGNDATPLGTGPEWRDVSTPTGRPALYFESFPTLGAPDRGLEVPTISASTPTQTVAAVVWANPGYDAEMTIAGSTAAGGLHWFMQTSRHMLAVAQDGAVLGYEGTTPIPNSPDSSFQSLSTPANWAVVLVEVEEGVGARHYTNGVIDGDTTLDESLSGAGTLLLGTFDTGVDNPWSGYIGAIVRWDRLLDDYEKTEVMADLRDKWIDLVPRFRAFSSRGFMSFAGLLGEGDPEPLALAATLVATSTLTAAVTAWHLGTVLNPFDVSSPASVDFGAAEDTLDPESQEGDALAVDLWYRIESTATSTLTLTWAGAIDVGFEVFLASPDDIATSVDELSLVGFGPGDVLDVATGEGQVYYVRVHPMDDADNAATGTLSWSFAARPDGLIDLEVDAVAYDVPSWLRVSVTSATEDGDVEFRVDGTLILTEAADDAGTIVGFTVPLPTLTPGTHTLQALDVESGETSSKTFVVVIYTLDPDTPPGPAPEPTTPHSPDPVIRWIFERLYGPADTTETYTFPNNPSEMSTPHPPRVINPDHTTAPDGQAILWEGAAPATEWILSGFCFEEAHAEALEHWQGLNQRFWAIDHLQRAWVVTFETLEWTPVRDTQHPWAARYRIKLFIYDGPVTLT